MKIRHGFVSNSSSSSFIVAFKRKPKCECDLKGMMFEDDDHIFHHPYNDGEQYSTSKVTGTVFNDMKEPLNREEIIEKIMHGDFDGRPDYPFNDFSTKTEKEREANWKLYEKDVKIAAKKFVGEFLKKCGKKDLIYYFHYSDNDGDYGCALEHGDIFSKLKHVSISHH